MDRKKDIRIVYPFILLGACITLAIIGVFAVQWMGPISSDMELVENHSSHQKLQTNNIIMKKGSESKAAQTKPSVDLALRIDNVDPEELICGMTLSQLDAFHESQMAQIRKAMADPKAIIPLPFSDERAAPMTLGHLEELHKRQVASIQIEPFKLIPTPGGTPTTLTIEQLDHMHKQQEVESMSNLAAGSLPTEYGEDQAHGLPMSQVEQMIRRQQLSAEFDEVDDKKPIVLPPSSDGPYQMTNWDLIELHERQMDQVMKRTQPKGGTKK